MNQGRLVEYIDQGKFVCSVCLEDRGTRLHLLTSSNREVNLSPKRAILISGPSMDPSGPRKDLLDMLRLCEETRDRLKHQVDVKGLWELVRDEKESFGHSYLAQLVFGGEMADHELSALVRALFEDRLYFKLKDGRFRPNSEERVEEIARQKEEEALKEQRLKEGSAWLREVIGGKTPADPVHKEDIIRLLTQLALYGNEVPDFKEGKELLSRAGITDTRKSRDLLIRLGIWEEDENLELLRSSIKTQFSRDQLDESVRLANAQIEFKGRADLTGLATLTIDGPLTRDYDDALSLEWDEDQLHVGIHISDVAAVLSPSSPLDQEAATRASSLYLPRTLIPMIPPDLSQHSLSLKEGCDRPAISLLARLDRNGEILDFRFVPSVIRVHHQLTYDQVNASLHDDVLLKESFEMSRRLRQKRLAHGALNLSLPELNITFNADSSLSLEFVDQNTPSRMIVAEFMILYNWLAARFCRDHHIPTLYRTQSEPSEILSLDDAGYLYYVLQQRRKLSPLQIDTSPNPHYGLGLDAYTQASSPIRRYLDLVVQRQMKSFLTGQGPRLDEEGLEEIRMRVGPATKTLEIIKRKRLRYWMLKFLSRHRGEAMKAVVLDELKSKYRIALIDLYLVGEMKRQDGMIVRSGQEIQVEVKRVDPWEDLLELAYAGE